MDGWQPRGEHAQASRMRVRWRCCPPHHCDARSL